MNTKNNRRRQASVEKMEQALIEFLQTRELNEITVSDICKAADLNRSTFYANFADIYALADRVRDHILEDLAALYRPEIERGRSSHDFVRLFYHIRDNRLFYQTYFKLGYDAKHVAYCFDTHLADAMFANAHIDYHIEFFKNGLNAMIKLWLSRDCLETPEELNAILTEEYANRIANYPKE